MNTLSNTAQAIIDALIDNRTTPQEVASMLSKDSPEYIEAIYMVVKYHQSWYHPASSKAGAVLEEAGLAQWVEPVVEQYQEDGEIIEHVKMDGFYDDSPAYRLAIGFQEEARKREEESREQYVPSQEDLEIMALYPDYPEDEEDGDDESLYLGSSTMAKIRAQKLVKPKEDEEEQEGDPWLGSSTMAKIRAQKLVDPEEEAAEQEWYVVTRTHRNGRPEGAGEVVAGDPTEEGHPWHADWLMDNISVSGPFDTSEEAKEWASNEVDYDEDGWARWNTAFIMGLYPEEEPAKDDGYPPLDDDMLFWDELMRDE